MIEETYDNLVKTIMEIENNTRSVSSYQVLKEAERVATLLGGKELDITLVKDIEGMYNRQGNVGSGYKEKGIKAIDGACELKDGGLGSLALFRILEALHQLKLAQRLDGITYEKINETMIDEARDFASSSLDEALFTIKLLKEKGESPILLENQFLIFRSMLKEANDLDISSKYQSYWLVAEYSVMIVDLRDMFYPDLHLDV
jgi:hypothetical protein